MVGRERGRSRENMSAAACARSRRYAGRLRYDAGLEKALGNPDRILKTQFAGDLRRIAAALLKSGHAPKQK